MTQLWTPRGYQSDMHDFVVDTDGGNALWADMGLGKTGTTGQIIETLLFDRLSYRRVLIVGPKRVAYKAWPDEIRKWSHMADWYYRCLIAEDFGLTPGFRESKFFDEASGEIVKGRKKTKLQFGYDENDSLANRHAKADTKKRLRSYRERIHIVSWDFLYFLTQAYGVNWPYDLVVLDESSFVKNQDSARFRACRHISNYTDKIIELTGTPSTRSLIDLWSQVFLLDQGKRLGRTLTGFRDAYFTPDQIVYAGGQRRVASWKADADAKQRIYRAVGDIVVSLKAEDYLSLPPLIENRIAVELPEAARELYDKVETDLFALLDKGGSVQAATRAVLFSKLLQIANGTVYDTEKKAHKVHTAKLDALADIAEATPGNLLVAYSFKPEAAAIQSRFGKQARLIHTDTDIDDWNAGRIKIGYTHPASLGHGINAQHGGSNIVWMGPPPNLEHWLQLNKRLHRSGQTAETVIVSVLTAENTLDDYVRRAILTSKDDEQNDLMDAVRLRKAELGRKSGAGRFG